MLIKTETPPNFNLKGYNLNCTFEEENLTRQVFITIQYFPS